MAYVGIRYSGLWVIEFYGAGVEEAMKDERGNG